MGSRHFRGQDQLAANSRTWPKTEPAPPVYQPRLFIQIRHPRAQPHWADFVVLVHYTHHLLHLVNPNKSINLKPGEHLTVKLLFPDQKPEEITVQVAYHVPSNGSFGFRLCRFHGSFCQEMGRLLARSSTDYTPSRLKSLGLLTDSITELSTFEILQTTDEYRQLLELRYHAYRHAGKMDAKRTIQDMEDRFDERSLILIAKHGDRLIASMRLILNDADETGEHEQFIVLPESFPQKTDIIEITRVCTHPEYRGSDLLRGLFEYASKVAMSLDRKWIIGSSTPGLLPLYEKIGFRATGLFYLHHDLNHQRHHVFLGNKEHILLGRNVGPIHWNMIYRHVFAYARDQGLIRPTTRRDRWRIMLYEPTGWCIRLVKHYHRRLRLRRHSYQEDTPRGCWERS